MVQEWINGTKQKEPVTSPRIELRAEDGTVVSKITMIKKQPYIYTYKLDIGNIQSSKKYTINVVGTNKNNISTHQDIELAYSDNQIKEDDTYRYKVESGNLIKEEKINSAVKKSYSMKTVQVQPKEDEIVEEKMEKTEETEETEVEEQQEEIREEADNQEMSNVEEDNVAEDNVAVIEEEKCNSDNTNDSICNLIDEAPNYNNVTE